MDIKVMVVIYGLVMFVPSGEMNGKADKLTAIFVESHEAGTAYHSPKIHKLNAKNGLVPVALPSGNFHIQVTTGATGKVDLSARGSFAQLALLFDQPEDARIRGNCVEPEECKDASDKDLINGRATIEGEWQTRPSTYCCGLRLPLGDHDWARFSFRDPGSSEEPETDGMPLATALILETFANQGSFSVMLNDTVIELDIVDDRGVCRRWTGKDDHPCAILVLGNPSIDNRPCRHGDCRFDHHFARLFHLTGATAAQYPAELPYVTSAPVCPQPDELRDELCLKASVANVESLEAIRDPVNMPSVRCPPAFGQVASSSLAEQE